MSDDALKTAFTRALSATGWESIFQWVFHRQRLALLHSPEVCLLVVISVLVDFKCFWISQRVSKLFLLGSLLIIMHGLVHHLTLIVHARDLLRLAGLDLLDLVLQLGDLGASHSQALFQAFNGVLNAGVVLWGRLRLCSIQPRNDILEEELRRVELLPELLLRLYKLLIQWLDHAFLLSKWCCTPWISWLVFIEGWVDLGAWYIRSLSCNCQCVALVLSDERTCAVYVTWW